MRIIIAGNGKVGLSLTARLSAEGHELTLIDTNQQLLNATMERYDVMTLHGNCASMDILKQAGVMRADLLIAVTNADEINLLCCLTAHALNPNLHTIARTRNPEYTEQIFAMRDVFALSMTINPELQAAREIERVIKYPGFLKRDTFAKGRVEIVELRLEADSKLCDQALTDLYHIIKCKVLVCAVRRGGTIAIPDGNYRLKAGDRIYVTAPAENLTILLKSLGIITHKAKQTILCGGGRIGYYLAQQLSKNGVNVHIIEQNYEKCITLSDQLPNITVVNGDATSQSLLEAEGIEDCDALVALTTLDEMNMIISLYAKNCHVPQVITKVDHTDNSSILDSLNLDSIISPKELCCNTIVRYVRAMQNTTGAALTVHSLAEGLVEAMEFRADADTAHCGEPLKAIHLKKNVLIACITHGAKTEIPNGDSVFTQGDTIVVITPRDVAIRTLNDIFA